MLPSTTRIFLIITLGSKYCTILSRTPLLDLMPESSAFIEAHSRKKNNKRPSLRRIWLFTTEFILFLLFISAKELGTLCPIVNTSIVRDPLLLSPYMKRSVGSLPPGFFLFQLNLFIVLWSALWSCTSIFFFACVFPLGS